MSRTENPQPQQKVTQKERRILQNLALEALQKVSEDEEGLMDDLEEFKKINRIEPRWWLREFNI